MNVNKLPDALVDLASKTLKMIDDLPITIAGRHVSESLAKCITSAGIHYECSLDGKAGEGDIAVDEMREALYWIMIIERSGWLKRNHLEDIWDEANDVFDTLTSVVVPLVRPAAAPLQKPVAERPITTSSRAPSRRRR